MNKIIVGVILFVLLAVLGYIGFVIYPRSSNLESAQFGSLIEGSYKYQQDSTTSTQKDILNNPGILHRIIVGSSDTAGAITLLDSVTPITSATTVFKLAGDTLKGVYDVGIYFENGIMAVVSQSDVTFIFSPR